jgi:hypothetical protein
MKSTGRFSPIEATEDEMLENELENEITEIREYLFRYIRNIDSLLGKKRANEVYRNMIYTLTENIR